jgi:hypothetical protein
MVMTKQERKKKSTGRRGKGGEGQKGTRSSNIYG